MELRYIGPHDAVEVDLPPDQAPTQRVLIGRGEKHDFPAEVARRLLEQDTNWERASATSKKKTSTSRTGVDVDAEASLAEELSPAADETPADAGKKEQS